MSNNNAKEAVTTSKDVSDVVIATESIVATTDAAPASAVIPTTMMTDPPPVGTKWSKNGYGAPIDITSGKFSKEETELVKKAIEEFCNAKQITVSRLCSECDHKAELKGAWMEIAKKLPHRSVQSVYRHGIRQCHPFKRGAWSEQECATLIDLVTRLGKKWSNIQSKLNRSADSCRDKYREMSDEFIKGRWKEEETATLQRLIREHLNSQTKGATAAIEDMRELGKLVEESNIQISWSVISKKMGKRSRLSCFKKWQKMTGLFTAPTPDVLGATIADSAVAGKKKAFDTENGKDDAVVPAMKKVKTEKVDSKNNTTTATSDADLAAETVEALDLPNSDVLASV
jgi:Myb-like DNA-binding domain